MKIIYVYPLHFRKISISSVIAYFGFRFYLDAAIGEYFDEEVVPQACC